MNGGLSGIIWLLDFFLRKGAPKRLALTPTTDSAGLNPAPIALAAEHPGNDAGLGAADSGGILRWFAPENYLPAGGDYGALAGQHGSVDPAYGATPVADLAPVVELGGDHHRQASALINPFHGITYPGTGPEIDLDGPEARESREGQPCTSDATEPGRFAVRCDAVDRHACYIGVQINRLAGHGTLLQSHYCEENGEKDKINPPGSYGFMGQHFALARG